ncbi:MAG: alpha/beta hydrolase [Candidatus Eisenbacteria bacterium]
MFPWLRAHWIGVGLLIAVMAGVAVTAISFFTASLLLDHRGPHSAVTPADSGMAYQTVPLGARDGTRLEGWWIPPSPANRRPDLAVVVLAHAEDGPWTLVRPGVLVSGKARMLRHAAWLHRAGFIVLAFDFRSYGGSEGTRTTGGYLEQQDLEAAIRLAHERALGAPVAVLGEGMGATVALAVAARDSSIVGVVADSPGARWMDGMARVDSAGRGGPWWSRVAVGPLVGAVVAREIGRGYPGGGGHEQIDVWEAENSRVMLMPGRPGSIFDQGWRSQLRVLDFLYSKVGAPKEEFEPLPTMTVPPELPSAIGVIPN